LILFGFPLPAVPFLQQKLPDSVPRSAWWSARQHGRRTDTPRNTAWCTVEHRASLHGTHRTARA